MEEKLIPLVSCEGAPPIVLKCVTTQITSLHGSWESVLRKRIWWGQFFWGIGSRRDAWGDPTESLYDECRMKLEPGSVIQAR